MYTTASGVQIPQGTDAFNPAAQFKAWADAEAVYDNFFNVALDSNRTALAAPQLRDGIFCWVRSTGKLWSYQGSTWIFMATPLILGGFTPVSGYTNGASMDVSRTSGIVNVNFSLVKNSGTFTSATAVGVLDAGFRPISGTIGLACGFTNGTTGWVTIASDGTVTIYFTGTPANNVQFNATYRTLL